MADIVKTKAKRTFTGDEGRVNTGDDWEGTAHRYKILVAKDLLHVAEEVAENTTTKKKEDSTAASRETKEEKHATERKTKSVGGARGRKKKQEDSGS